MKKKLLSLLVACTLLSALAVLLPISASAQKSPDGNALRFAAKATTEPVIDGEIDEIWNTTVAMPFETPGYGYIKALWKEKALYLMAELHDCTEITFLTATRFYNSTEAGTWNWGGNRALTCTATTDSSAEDFTPTAPEFIKKTWNGWAFSGADKTAKKTVLTVKSKATENGFIVELKITLPAGNTVEDQKADGFFGLGAYVNGDYKIGNCVGIAETPRDDKLGLTKSPYALYAVQTVEACKHQIWTDANCLAPKTCRGCGKTEGEINPANHAKEPTWEITDEKHKGTYPCCNTVVEGAHDWVNLDIAVEPTCTTPGKSSRKCKVCEKTVDTAEIPALGHDFAAEYTVDQAPDCTNKGSESRHCTRCDATTDAREIAALGHDFAAEFTKDSAADCTHDGMESRHCTRCNEVTDSRKYEDALGHDLTDWTIVKPATCAEPGSRHKTCKRCWAEVELEEVTVPHTAGEWVIDQEAAVGVAGKRHHVCTVCGAVFDEETIPALEKKGCLGSLGTFSVAGMLLLPAGIMLGRKRKRKQ